MDFYERKQRAISAIDKMIEARTNVATIKVEVVQKYGISGKFVDTYLKNLKDSGRIHLMNGEIEYE